ncbi:MAG TPA: DUF202 domain-containing protein [Aldersonia sp.]
MSERWPKWVYGAGEDPDYRFSFANERTFLAWLRTSLALVAAGVALDAVHLEWPRGVQVSLAVALIALGLLCAFVSWARWARSERAMRTGAPLPGFLVGAILVGAVLLIGLAILLAWT